MFDQISNAYEIGSENISMKSPREGNHPPESQTIRHLTLIDSCFHLLGTRFALCDLEVYY